LHGAGLDINTPRGQRTVADERRCVEIVERSFPDWRYVHTIKAREAVVDGFLENAGEVKAVVAQTSRYNLTLEKFQTAFNNQWLLSLHKLLQGKDLAAALCVPFYGFLYLVEDDAVLSQRLWDEGGWRVRFTVDKTETQATVNGGKALRDNAYIDMKRARILRQNSED